MSTKKHRRKLSTKRIIIIAALLTCAAVFITLAAIDLNKYYFNPVPQVSGGSNEEMSIPETSLQDLNGKEVSLTDYRGKVLLISYWSPNDSKSLDQLNYLDEFSKEISGRDDVALLAVTAYYGEQTVEDIKTVMDSNGYTFDTLIDGGSLQYTLDAYDYPYTFAFDKNGNYFDFIFYVREGSLNRLVDAVFEATA